MRHQVKTNEDGSVSLKLGLHKNVTFAEDASPDDVAMGVIALINEVTGVDAHVLIGDVVTEFLMKESIKVETVENG